MNFFFYKPTILKGDVIHSRIIVSGDQFEFDNSKLWMIFSERKAELESELKKSIYETLGTEFELTSIGYRKGSIEILLVIGTVYYAISKYKNFLESIDLLVSQLKRIIEKHISRIFPTPITVSGSWTPGSSLARIETINSLSENIACNTVLIYYLIINHAVLLSVVLWLLLRS